MAVDQLDSSGDFESTGGAEAKAVGVQQERVYVFTDMVGSLEFKRRWGDTVGRKVLLRHDEIFRECLARFSGEENKETGDGFHATFPDPVSAVQFALNFQRGLEGMESPEAIRCRVAMHRGPSYKVVGSPPVPGNYKYVGAAVDLAFKIMRAAEGRQILVTREVYDAVHATSESLLEGAVPEWRAHGAYYFKGLADPVDLFEIGVSGFAPLTAPRDASDIQRDLASEREETLGWRPSAKARLPGRAGVTLERRIGLGGFGEVWLGCDASSANGACSVFKFCFETSKLRALRREQTVLRFIREALGDRNDIAKILQIELSDPPYYLESEYAEGGDLIVWSERRGGLSKLPIETRLGIVARVADAVAAAHSVGVIHKDLKPSNILVRDRFEEAPRLLLADFGIATILVPDALEAAGITAAGFTVQTLVPGQRAFESGTRVYMAPELMVGGRSTIQSDIYALGVLLYQMIVGDFSRPLAHGWETGITDSILRSDVEACIAGDPARRLSDAGAFARRLRDVPKRRADQQAADRLELSKAAVQRRHKILAGLLLMLSFLSLVLAFIWIKDRRNAAIQSRLLEETKVALDAAERQRYRVGINLAQMRLQEGAVASALETLLATPEAVRGIEWDYLVREACPEAVTLTGHTAGLRGVRVNPSGDSILTYSEDSTARLWDYKTGKIRKILSGHTKRVLRGEFSPDGSRIITCSDDGTARVWSGEGNLIAVLHDHSGPVNKARFSADGALIVTASDDGTAGVWEASGGKRIALLRGHNHAIFDACFSPDGSLVATASDDRTVRVWDSGSGEIRAVLSEHAAEVNAVAFGREGHFLASGSQDGQVILWERTSGGGWNPARKCEEQHSVRHLEFNPDGDELLVAAERPEVTLWDLNSGEVHHVSNGIGDMIESATYGAGGTLIGAASRDGKAYIFGRAATGREYELLSQARSHRDFVTDICVHPSGESFSTASGDGTAKIWGIPPHFRKVDRWRRIAYPPKVEAVRFSPDSDLLAVGGKNIGLLVHRAPDMEIVNSLGEKDCSYLDLCFSPGGRSVAACTDEGGVELWDLQTNKRLWHSRQTTASVNSVDFSPDGQRLATGNAEGGISLWDASTGALITSVSGHDAMVRSIRFSPEGERLVTASSDRTATVWTGHPLKRGVVLPDHHDEVMRARFSSDGRRILTCAFEGTATVWDAEVGARLAVIRSGVDHILDAALSPDGTRVLTTSSDGRIQVWDANSAEETLNIPMDRGSVGRPWWIDRIEIAPDGLTIAMLRDRLQFETHLLAPWTRIKALCASGRTAEEALHEWMRADYEAWNRRRPQIALEPQGPRPE